MGNKSHKGKIERTTGPGLPPFTNPNGYAGKSPADVWDHWDERQRYHFLMDHLTGREAHVDYDPDNVMYDNYDALPKSLKSEIINHMAEGQYEQGGNTPINIAANILEKTKDKKKIFWPVFYKYGTLEQLSCPYVGDRTFPTLTEAKQWLVDNEHQIEKEMNWSVRFFPHLANMPVRTFMNRYDEKSAEEVWNAWDPQQRLHFCLDHSSAIIFRHKKITGQNILRTDQWSEKAYSDIPEAVKEELKEHVEWGQYEAGGNVTSSIIRYDSVWSGPVEIDITKSRKEFALDAAQAYSKRTGKKKTKRVIDTFETESGSYHAVRNIIEKIDTQNFSDVVDQFRKYYPIASSDWKSALKTGLVVAAGKRVGNYSTGEFIFTDDLAKRIREAGLNNVNPIVDEIMSSGSPSEKMPLIDLAKLINQELSRLRDHEYYGTEEFERNDKIIYDNLPYDPETDAEAIAYTIKATPDEILHYNLTRVLDAMSTQRMEEGGIAGEEDEVDLFEHYDELPEELQALIDEYNGRYESEDPYHLGTEMETRFAALGYEFDFGLDGEASNLRKMKSGSGRVVDLHYEKGGVVADDMALLKATNPSSITIPEISSRITEYVKRYGSIAPTKLLGSERKNISMLAALVRMQEKEKPSEEVAPAQQDYIDALEAARIMLDLADTDEQKQEYEDYIAGLEAMIDVSGAAPSGMTLKQIEEMFGEQVVAGLKHAKQGVRQYPVPANDGKDYEIVVNSDATFTVTPYEEPDTDKEWYIEYFNASKGHQRDKKYFDTVEEAMEWGRSNIDNFNQDMVRINTAYQGGQKKNLTDESGTDAPVPPSSSDEPKLSAAEESALLELLKQTQLEHLEKAANELNALKSQRDAVEAQRIALRGSNDINEKTRLSDQSANFLKRIIYQENRVKVLSLGSTLVSFTDRKGAQYEGIPFFIPLPSTLISFDEETIQSQPLPDYVPLINEDAFRRKGYVFDAIRIAPDQYILAINGYSEKADHEPGYIMVTLDQLVLINEYYVTKERAKNRIEAEEKNKRQVDYYFSLPEERRRRHFDNSVPYRSLPSAIQKKVPKSDWDAMTFEQKEQIYQPVKRYGVKRISSKLTEKTMWASFHLMYNRFLNPEALPAKGKDLFKWVEQGWYSKEDVERIITRSPWTEFGNPEVFAYWHQFSDMLNWKVMDIRVQNTELSEFRKAALETSFGESNTSDALLNEYGIKIKRQNGDKISPVETEQIAVAWSKVESVFGPMKREALAYNMKISHTGTRHVFASRAIGMYVPDMHTIAVSAKYGEEQFQATMAHEIAHWIDRSLGHTSSKRYLSDNYESSAGKIATLFRKSTNKKTDSDYLNATKECFARAMEQYFSTETYGLDATLLFSNTPYSADQKYVTADQYVGLHKWPEIKELIVAFLNEHKSFFGK